MPDILLRLPIRASTDRVFEMIATPVGLDAWWTLTSDGTPAVGEEYLFGFGPGYEWRGVVSAYDEGRWVEWEMTDADRDWTGTRVGARLSEADGRTVLDFYHTGWRHANDHYRTSSCCWAQYLRVLRRFLEHGERVEYDVRLDV